MTRDELIAEIRRLQEQALPVDGSAAALLAVMVRLLSSDETLQPLASLALEWEQRAIERRAASRWN